MFFYNIFKKCKCRVKMFARMASTIAGIITTILSFQKYNTEKYLCRNEKAVYNFLFFMKGKKREIKKSILWVFNNVAKRQGETSAGAQSSATTHAHAHMTAATRKPE